VQHGNADAAKGSLIGWQQGDDAQSGICHFIKVQLERLGPNKVRPEAGFLGVALEHGVAHGGSVQGKSGPAEYGFGIDGSHG